MKQSLAEVYNEPKLKILKPEDVKIGMRVKSRQLENVLDTYILLTDVKLLKNRIGMTTLDGIVSAISKEPIRITQENSVLIYHDSYEREENCEYE